MDGRGQSSKKKGKGLCKDLWAEKKGGRGDERKAGR